MKSGPRSAIGKRAEARRVELGLTVKDVADRAGFTERTYYRIIRAGKKPRGETVQALALALELTVDYLLQGPDVQPPRTLRGWKDVGDAPPDIRGLNEDVTEALRLMKSETGETPNLEDEDSRVRFLAYLQQARRARQERERAAGNDRSEGEDGEPTAPRNGRLSPGPQSA